MGKKYHSTNDWAKIGTANAINVEATQNRHFN
jgi:hypothetical protein